MTVEAVQARAPRACTSPETRELFDKQAVLQVFRTKCHDGDPSDPWDLYTASHKTALEPRLLPLRLLWAERTLQRQDSAGWYYRHCIWFDPCHTIVSRGPRAAFNHKQARGRGKRWSSKGTKDTNEKLSSSKHGRKQNK